MWRAQTDNRVLLVVLVSLCLLAWLALLVWEASPLGVRLHHSQLHNLSVSPTTAFFVTSGLFVAGWLLMTVAMMLPTSVPLVLLFGQITRRYDDRTVLIALVLLGYVATWVAFGLGAYGFDLGLHRLVESSRWLHANTWLLLALPLMLAGAYQFTPLKYACLDKCRSPLSFIAGNWRGRSRAREALKLGLHHGLYCVGCCWSLMLLMFALSIGNIFWMLGLAVVMGIEKNLSWGRRLSSPVGIVLLTAGTTVLAMNLGAS